MALMTLIALIAFGIVILGGLIAAVVAVSLGAGRRTPPDPRWTAAAVGTGADIPAPHLVGAQAGSCGGGDSCSAHSGCGGGDSCSGGPSASGCGGGGSCSGGDPSPSGSSCGGGSNCSGS
ncbi:hypothetical protein GCM10011591_37860 [Nocardia camponoti]|uniref:Uncharacterized protein n=1 Tax=Nocardia camponoti TaxID=1616106 RepID=A0A917QPQ2_9NOCA|nr:hypothetical protein GCM10011591_37860 [Nocardia camponoti]